jgi:hypothetical protein
MQSNREMVSKKDFIGLVFYKLQITCYLVISEMNPC